MNQTDNRQLRKGYFKEHTPIGQVTVPSDKYRADQVATIIRGGCMDSDSSPMRIKDGDYIVMHQEPLTEESLSAMEGKVVLIKPKGSNTYYAKEILVVDTESILIGQYVPMQSFRIARSNIEAIFLIDYVGRI